MKHTLIFSLVLVVSPLFATDYIPAQTPLDKPIPAQSLLVSDLYIAIQQGNVKEVKDYLKKTDAALNELRGDVTPLMQAIHELGKEMIAEEKFGFKSPFYPTLVTTILFCAYGTGFRDHHDDPDLKAEQALFLGVKIDGLSDALAQVVSKSALASFFFWLVPNIFHNTKEATQWIGYTLLKNSSTHMPLILGHRAKVHRRINIVAFLIKDSRLNPAIKNSKGETAFSLIHYYKDKVSAKKNSAALYRLEQWLLDKSVAATV